MANTILKYGKLTQTIDLPELDFEFLQNASNFHTLSQIEIHTEIERLVEAVQSKVHSGARILLIVPDHTRKCKLDVLLPHLTFFLEEQLQAQLEILIANGSHVLQPAEVIENLLSREILQKYTVMQHDAKNLQNSDYFGKTSYGTEIYLHKAVKQADFIITVGAILYHYFAGFGGGPKMLLPGVAAYETIRQNHNLTIDREHCRFQPNCYEGNIHNNPVYQDLVQVLNFVPNCLSLQMVLLENGDIYKMASGPIQETQELLLPELEKLFLAPISTKRNLVIADAGGFPADVNLIQTHKSIHHAFKAVNEGGTIIMFAACDEGIGSQTFLPFLQMQNAQEIARKLSDEYLINGQTALALREKAEKARIILVTDLDAEIVRHTGMIPAKNWEQAWEMVQHDYFHHGYILKNAAVCIPHLRSNT